MNARKRLTLSAAAAILGVGIATTTPSYAFDSPGDHHSHARSSISPASNHRVDACFNGACGSATYTRSSSYAYRPVNMSVKDNKCDGHPSYIQAWVEDGSASGHFLTKHYNHLGCHGGYASWSSHVTWPAPINALGFKICVDDWGTDTCRWAS